MSRRRRLDAELIRRSIVDSRTQAGEAIAAGLVLVNGATADKASRQVDPGDAIVLSGPPARFVSRGGEKLDHALDTFAIDVAGAHALDAGASTGGFTDCLLQRGAAHVAAVDVGHGQLHPRIRADPRVAVFEHRNVRGVTNADIGGPFGLIVADLSFISLTRVLPDLLGVAAPRATLVMLVKPQFEAGRVEVARGRGVITDVAVHERVRAEVDGELRAAGCAVVGWAESPLRGAQGNVEFLVHAVADPQGSAS